MTNLYRSLGFILSTYKLSYTSYPWFIRIETEKGQPLSYGRYLDAGDDNTELVINIRNVLLISLYKKKFHKK